MHILNNLQQGCMTQLNASDKVSKSGCGFGSASLNISSFFFKQHQHSVWRFKWPLFVVTYTTQWDTWRTSILWGRIHGGVVLHAAGRYTAEMCSFGWYTSRSHTSWGGTPQSPIPRTERTAKSRICVSSFHKAKWFRQVNHNTYWNCYQQGVRYVQLS